MRKCELKCFGVVIFYFSVASTTTTAVDENALSSTQTAETSEVPEETSVVAVESSREESETTSRNFDGSSVSIGVSGENNETTSEDMEVTDYPVGTSGSDDKIFTSSTDVISSSTLEPIPNLELSTHEVISRSGEEATVTGDSTDVEPSGSGNAESFTTSLVASITVVVPSGTAHVETSSSIVEGTVTDESTDIRLLYSEGSELFTTAVATSSTPTSTDSGTVIFSSNVETSSSIEEETVADKSTDIESFSGRNLNPFTTTLVTSSTSPTTDSGIVDAFSSHVETSSSAREATVTDESTDVEPTCDRCTESSFRITVTTSVPSGIPDSGTTSGLSSDTHSSRSVFPNETIVEVTSSADIQTASSVSTELETWTTPITPIVDVVEEIIDILEKHPVSHLK